MKTIATENRIPTHIAALYGGSRNFRILMRQKVAQARKAMASFDTLGSFTFADPKDVRDVLVLLDRIKLDLSQTNWGK